MKKINVRKINYLWSILSLGVATDQRTNNVTLFSVVEQIKFPRKKLIQSKEKDILAVPIELNFTMLFKKFGERDVKANIRIDLVDPAGKVLQEFDHELMIAKENRRTRFSIGMAGLRVTKSGDYLFRIKVLNSDTKDYEVVGGTELQIDLI